MLNFKEKNKIFVTSDTHFHHNKDFIWKNRGYSSIKNHDDDIIDIINKKVKPDDILIHLGDFCLNASLSQFEELISRIYCQNIYMLFGNHPNPHYKNIYKPLVKTVLGETYFDNNEVYPLRYRNVVYIGNYTSAILDGQFCILCHYPISVWDEMQNGAWMLCGHSHYGFEPSRAESLAGKILDVGWDGHKAPWSLQEIAAVMAKKGFNKVDHHGPGMGKMN